MRYRSSATEIMDDFEIEGRELEDALDKIAWINRILGGNNLTRKAVMEVIGSATRSKPISIVDWGCGNGDMLRALSDFGRNKGIEFNLQGIDANAFTVKHAEELSSGYDHISYQCKNILDPGFDPEPCDIVLLTLTLHHFTEPQIIQLLKLAAKRANLAIIINDLERSRLAYGLFSCLSKIFKLGSMNDTDGKLSILRGFRRNELELIAEKMNFKQYSIRWKWAFRYQWIITDL